MLIAILLAAAAPDKLPPASPLPPPDSDEAAVMVPVHALLAALEKDDGAAVLAVTQPDGIATAVQSLPDGSFRHRSVRWADFAASLKPDGTRIAEAIGAPAIEIDGGVAMVWAPYTVSVNGTLSHCGYDHFDLIRVAQGWKILNATWSHRTTDCAR